MNHDEDRIQADIVFALSALGVFLFMVPNSAAGKTTQARAARLKAMGLRAGVSDLILMGDDGRSYFLEIKTESGRLSESQLRFRDICIARGWPYAVTRSLDDAIAQARAWGLIK